VLMAFSALLTRVLPIKIMQKRSSVVWTNTDVTERKIVEQALARSEAHVGAVAVGAERQQLFDILETLPIMICLLTRLSCCLSNLSFREKFGESVEMLL